RSGAPPPQPRARRGRSLCNSHRRRLGRAAAAPGPRDERARSPRRRRDLPIRRFLELAGSLRVDGDAAAARLGRAPRFSRPDELLGASGLPGPASHGAALCHSVAPAPQLAAARRRPSRCLGLLRRTCLARSAPLRRPLGAGIRRLSQSDPRADADRVLRRGPRRRRPGPPARAAARQMAGARRARHLRLLRPPPPALPPRYLLPGLPRHPGVAVLAPAASGRWALFAPPRWPLAAAALPPLP